MLGIEPSKGRTRCYAVQNKTWVSDPDGNAWEVFVVLEDNLPEPVETSATARCTTAPSLATLTK